MKISILNVSFEIDPFESLPFWKSYEKGELEKETFEIIKRFVGEEDIVLDIGSWAGPFTLFSAHLAKMVYALEPDPVAFPQLAHNVSLNAEIKDKIAYLQFALSNKNGRQTLYARKQYGQSSSSLLQRSRDRLAKEECDTITLSELLKTQQIDRVHFMKMDIEGGEFTILPELKAVLDQLNYPTLIISFHSDQLKEYLFKKRIHNLLLTKALIKLESIFKFSLFKKKLYKLIRSSLQSLEGYRNIYTVQGEEIAFGELMKQPQLIKNKSLIFTNESWTN